ncbi:hypothetical protein U1Q18_050269 [Sarracenia purpurea var. burkii]
MPIEQIEGVVGSRSVPFEQIAVTALPRRSQLLLLPPSPLVDLDWILAAIHSLRLQLRDRLRGEDFVSPQSTHLSPTASLRPPFFRQPSQPEPVAAASLSSSHLRRRPSLLCSIPLFAPLASHHLSRLPLRRRLPLLVVDWCPSRVVRPSPSKVPLSGPFAHRPTSTVSPVPPARRTPTAPLRLLCAPTPLCLRRTPVSLLRATATLHHQLRLSSLSPLRGSFKTTHTLT